MPPMDNRPFSMLKTEVVGNGRKMPKQILSDQRVQGGRKIHHSLPEVGEWVGVFPTTHCAPYPLNNIRPTFRPPMIDDTIESLRGRLTLAQREITLLRSCVSENIRLRNAIQKELIEELAKAHREVAELKIKTANTTDQ